MQIDLFGGSNDPNEPVEIRDGNYIHIPDFYSKNKANFYFDAFKNRIVWKQESMFLYGKEVKFPRLTAWYGDNDKPYSFSGITLQPLGWTEELHAIKQAIEPISKVQFNSVL